MRDLIQHPITEDEIMRFILDLQRDYIGSADVEWCGSPDAYIARNICDFLTEHTAELAKRMEIKIEDTTGTS